MKYSYKHPQVPDEINLLLCVLVLNSGSDFLDSGFIQNFFSNTNFLAASLAVLWNFLPIQELQSDYFDQGRNIILTVEASWDWSLLLYNAFAYKSIIALKIQNKTWRHRNINLIALYESQYV